MPNIPDLSAVLPMAPLHWTSIAHYLILVGALVMLFVSGDKSPMSFILVLLIWAVVLGVSLYLNRLPLPGLITFLVRVAILGIPLLMAGLGPNRETRQLGVLTAIIALPLLVSTLMGCWFNFLMDPRLAGWC